MNADVSNVEDTNISPNHENVCQCLALNLLESGPTSFALDHSPCARMTVTFTEKFDSAAVSESMIIIDYQLR